MDIMGTMKTSRDDSCSVSYRILIGCAIFCYIIFSSGFVKTLPMTSVLSLLLYVFLLVFMLFRRITENRFSIMDGLLILFYLIQLLSTCLGSHDYRSWLFYATQGLGAFLVFEEGMWEMPIRTLLYTRNILLVLNTANLLSVLFFSKGFGGSFYFVLGYRIGFSPFVLLGLAVSLIYDYFVLECRFSKWSMLCLTITGLALYIQKVSTGLLCTAILVVAVILYSRLLHRIANYWLLFGGSILLFLILAVWNNADWFTAFFEAIGKDATLNMRTFIWAEAKGYIAQKPLLGYGVTDTGAFMINSFYYKRALPSHNQILHILYEGGALSCICYMAIFLVLGKKIRRYHFDYSSYLMSILIFSLLIMMITEIQTQKALFFLIIALAYTCVEYRPVSCWKFKECNNETD